VKSARGQKNLKCTEPYDHSFVGVKQALPHRSKIERREDPANEVPIGSKLDAWLERPR
jgi:hypothetical protein